MRIKLLLSLIILCSVLNAQYTKLLDFAGTSNGSTPYGSLISDGTFFYGMTKLGGLNDLGVVFKIKPDGTGYSKLLDFAGASNGQNPIGSLFFDGTFLYGLTHDGGLNSMGVIFKIKPDGSGYTKLLDFSTTINGRNPAGSLISDGSFIYGMTTLGGTNDIGVIFKIKPDGTGFLKLRDFDQSSGRSPYGSLVSDGSSFYGMTRFGGINGQGLIFKILPDGSGYSKLFEFNGTNGSSPLGSLIYDGTFLYGTTIGGGNDGIIFKIKTDGTGFSQLFDFTFNATGSFPRGSLLFDGTFLYGMAHQGGPTALGNIFKIKPDGTGFTRMLDFSGTSNGSAPDGDLISDGTFLYGMTETGGINGLGTIFKIGRTTLPDAITENETDAGLKIFPNPFSTQLTLESNSNLKAATVTIYNLLGLAVKELKNISGPAVTIFRNDLQNGLYFIEVTQDDKVILKEKLIISD